MAQYRIIEEWLTNCWGPNAANVCRELTNWPSIPYVGAPQATDSYSVEELQAMGVVGIYRVVKVDHDPRENQNERI
jgi:hypothetical protein